MTLSEIRGMSLEEFHLWIAWMNLKAEQSKKGKGGGTMNRRERRKLE